MQVLNVAPTPTTTGPTEGVEGTTVSLGSLTDPSVAETNAGFTKSWTITKDDVAWCPTGIATSFSFVADDKLPMSSRSTPPTRMAAPDRTRTRSSWRCQPDGGVPRAGGGQRGGSATLQVMDASDPGSAGVAAGLRFSSLASPQHSS